MKQFLLTGILSVAAFSIAVAAPVAEAQLVNAAENLKITKVKNTAPLDVKKLAHGVTVTTANGVKKLHSIRSLESNNSTLRRQAPHKAESADDNGYVLFESFEGWDGSTLDWTPEGWTVDMRGEVARAASWTPSAPAPGIPSAADGQYYYAINFDTAKQDEWLISPLVEIEDAMVLSYYLYLEPTFLFNLDNVDWDKYEFIGDKTVAATLQIWAQPEGGEWTMLHDFVDDYKDMTLLEMAYLTPAALEKKSEDLSAFAGKKIKVAFRYVGADGNTMFIDAIGIGYPALDGISYMDPFSTLYWGFSRGWELSGITAPIAHYPVYAPLTWTNMSYIDGATYSWDYCDPVTAEIVTSDEQDELTVTYVPDYSSEASLRNNFFYPPTLKATAPGATPGSYQAPYPYFQAGGKVERPLTDGTMFEGTLMPFAFQNSGVTFVSVDDETIGDQAIPVFGYNRNTDKYWLNYSLNGEDALEGDYSRLEGIANLFFANEAPLVVNGINVYGWGQIGADAELTATIYALNSEMNTDISTFTTIASATIKGSDIIAEYSDAKGYLCLPFDFKTPAVVQATEEHPAYFFMLQGFNSDKVEYFAPLQSQIPDPNNMCLGYILNHIDLSNHVDRDPYYSIKNMVYKENGEYVDLYGSFAIGIDGEYPWLTCDYEGVVMAAGSNKEVVPLKSYYDGSKLTVEAPAGITATVEGRYDNCMLTIERNDAAVVVDGDITVKGPGVELSLYVKTQAAGINSVNAAGATVTGIYDLSGRRVQSAENGVYIIKYSDGTVSKTFSK